MNDLWMCALLALDLSWLNPVHPSGHGNVGDRHLSTALPYIYLEIRLAKAIPAEYIPKSTTYF